jgi:hypothetical protein
LICNIFGEHILNYCIIVFTGLDNLDVDGLTIEQFLERSIPSLTTLIEKCGRRFLAFNNRASIEEKNHKIQELLDLVDLVMRNHDNEVFTNKEIEMISKSVEEETRKGTFLTNQVD